MNPSTTASRIARALLLAAVVLSSPHALADLKVTFSGGGDNTTPTGTISVNLGTPSASMSNLTGTAGLNAPVVTGALPGLSGSFDINFQALGTVASPFNSGAFTGGAAAGIHAATNATWAVNSDLNALANTVPGQGIVFTFDFTNLVGASAIDLKAVRWNNDSDGCRLSFRNEGTGTSTAIYAGGGGSGSNQTINFATMPSVDTADQIAFFAAGGGQRRLAEFTFSFTPAGIVPPTGLAATTNGAQVNLDWDDDLSGTLAFYTVKRSETAGGPYTQVETNVLTSNYTDTTVATGTTYHYVVTATDNVGPTESGNSNQASIQVRIQPPTSLTRTQGNGVIGFDWADNTSGILDFYTVYRSETSGGPYTQVETNLTTSAYSDTTVTNGTTYYYVVTATDNVVALESANSGQVSGTPFAPVPGNTLHARLDGSDAGSVTADGSDVVSLWADQTANGFDASSTGASGQVFYPSLSVSGSGLDGMDFGFTPATSRSTLVWFTPAEQDQWLDFSSGAGALPYGGFAVFAVVHPDTILGGTNRDVVMSSTETNFSLRYEGGRPQMRLGNSVLQGTAGAVQVNTTVVLAVSYNAATGALELWDSASGTTSTSTVSAADFSSTSNLFLGGSVNPDQYMKGMLGEAKVFRGAMSPAEFSAERASLAFKWSGLQTPSGLVANSGDGNVALDWNDQVADSFTVYRGTTQGGPYTPLATGVLTSGYADTTVTEGTTYYYVVTATESSYGESPQSTEVVVTPYTSVAGSTLYVHLDATDAGSVTTTTGVVNAWQDLTANGIDAVEVTNGTPGEDVDTGDVLYPSTSLSASGLAGVNFGPDRNLLRLFDPAGQDGWLDFTSGAGAAPYSGFAVFIALKADSILGSTPPQARDVVFANADAITGKFLIRYQSGRPEMYLNGVPAFQGANRIVAGDTVILAANYNTATGALEFWDSASGTSANATVPAADFSSLKSMHLGGSINVAQRMDGMIGEVKIYRGALSGAAFASERDALVAKWITGTTGGYSAWQTANNTTGAIDEDHDADGVSNGVEHFLGGDSDTTGFTALPGVVNTAGVLSVTWTRGAGYSGDYDTDFWIETSTTLSGAWTKETLGGGNVTDDPGFVKYTFPAPLTGKRFVRLKVTGP